MSETVLQADGWTGRVAAVYARVSSERQRQDETIRSQTVGLRELATARGLLVSEDLVFEDEGFSGASLQRPALERFYAEDFLPHRLIRSQRIHWDHATLARQLGIPGPPSA